MKMQYEWGIWALHKQECFSDEVVLTCDRGKIDAHQQGEEAGDIC